MKQNRTHEHTVDFVFALALFFVFAASSLAVVMLALQSYQAVTAREGENYALRTGASYVSQKVRHMDRANAVSTGTIDGLSALILAQEFGGEPYITYIYCQDGSLKELFVRQDTVLSAASGKEILPLTGFLVEETAPGLFHFTMQTPDGTVHELDVSTRT